MADYHVNRPGNPGFIPGYPHATSRTEQVLVNGIPMYTATFRAEQVDQCEKLDDNYTEIVT